MNLTDLPYALAAMTVEDLPAVLAIERVVFTLPWSLSAFQYELRYNTSSEYLTLRYQPWVGQAKRALPRPVRRLLGASNGDPSLIGYGGFWMMLDEAHICTLAVKPAWQGRGLGELLLAGLIERAMARGAAVVTLEVRLSNTKAQNLYRKYGFREVGRRKGYYSDNQEDALIMTTESITSPDYRQLFARLEERLRERLLAQSTQPPVEAEASV